MCPLRLFETVDEVVRHVRGGSRFAGCPPTRGVVHRVEGPSACCVLEDGFDACSRVTDRAQFRARRLREPPP